MEAENVGSISVDLNENEEGGGGETKARNRARVQRLSGVSGGRTAGKGHVCVTANGSSGHTDAMREPLPGGDHLPGPVTCVVLNGFSEESGAAGEAEPGAATCGHRWPPCPLPNGEVRTHRAGETFCDRSRQFSGPTATQTLCSSEEGKVANGGLHIATDTQPEPRPGPGACVREHPSGPTSTGSGARLSSPCASSLSSPRSEPNTRDEEDEEDEEEAGADLKLPVRPHTLRTDVSFSMSLSCDATPLSPDGEGGFYFGAEGYEEDLRSVFEAGRRQSAPDKLPDLAGQVDGSDPKLMPKRFGIAEFFTR